MKPIIIYSMPRTRSHAALSAAKHNTKLYEPFGFRTLFKFHVNESYTLPVYFSNLITSEQWNTIRSKMDSPNTATKFFGYHIFENRKARQWWQNVQDNKTHDIFVLKRDRTELCMSMLLGKLIGFQSNKERLPLPLCVSDHGLWIVYRYIEEHLKYFPTKGTLVTLDTLPTSYFDVNKITSIPQNSLSKLNIIQNLDWCYDRIFEILDAFKDEWDNKENNLREQ